MLRGQATVNRGRAAQRRVSSEGFAGSAITPFPAKLNAPEGLPVLVGFSRGVLGALRGVFGQIMPERSPFPS